MKKLFMIFTILFSLSLFGDSFAKNLSFRDVNGNKITFKNSKDGLIFDQYKGKVIFLEFFGHNCPPCKRTIPHLREFSDKYNSKLKIIGVEVQGYNNSDLKRFASLAGINYTMVSRRENSDVINLITSEAGWNGGIPFLMALDKKGEVAFIHEGYLSKGKLQDLITILDNQ